MMLLKCPNCGERNVQEFRYGGEVNPRPARPLETSDAEWADYVYMRRNRAGVQKEWWYHGSGCGRWFVVERDTRGGSGSGFRGQGSGLEEMGDGRA